LAALAPTKLTFIKGEKDRLKTISCTCPVSILSTWQMVFTKRRAHTVLPQSCCCLELGQSLGQGMEVWSRFACQKNDHSYYVYLEVYNEITCSGRFQSWPAPFPL